MGTVQAVLSPVFGSEPDVEEDRAVNTVGAVEMGCSTGSRC
jgi:hypothetical protein